MYIVPSWEPAVVDIKAKHDYANQHPNNANTTIYVKHIRLSGRPVSKNQ